MDLNFKAAASAAEVQIFIISNGFCGFIGFPCFQTLFIDFDTILSFRGLEMEADILARRDVGDAVVQRPRFRSHIVFS